jgi:ectoine hydroxylase-related dioxygenase (phytanoyl-CoA dioxygenase family)
VHVAALNLPDAADLEVLSVHPERELENCNRLLDDPAGLQKFYQEHGYLLGRGVLNPQSVAEARDAMLAVAARQGLIRQGDQNAVWTGRKSAGGTEESAEFRGVSKRLFAYADNLQVLERLLGEKACWVPNVQHRIYPPGGSITPVHQDGFYSPGIFNYRPVWVPLTPCPRAVGGLMIAVGQNQRGYLHNLAKPTPFPIPEGVIPPDSWATTDYQAGDLLIIHPCAPHASMPNRSDRLRVTLDTRVQSSANPTAFAATVLAVNPDSIRVDAEGMGERTFRVDAETCVRVVNPGISEPYARFTQITHPGMRLVVVRDGDHALMLRRASEA